MKPASFLNRFLTASPAQAGFTLIELAAVIAIIGILAAYGLMSVQGLDEDRDAKALQSAQATLQTVITQGAARMDVKPANLNPALVLIAVRGMLGENGANNGGVTFNGGGGTFTATVVRSGRSATFAFNNAMQKMCLTGQNGFSKYGVDPHDNCTLGR